MPVFGPNNLRLGATQINKAYLGATLLFDGAAPSPALPDLDYDVLLEAYDPDSLFSDTAGTTPASVDGSVARVNDTSVNSNNATQATAAARPIRRQLGDLNWLDHDGVDDRLVIAPNASWNKTGMSVVMALRVPDFSGRMAFFGCAGATNMSVGLASSPGFNVGVVNSGDIIAGAVAYYTNGSFLGLGSAVTRNALYESWVTGQWVIAEAANCDLDTFYSEEGAQLVGRQGATDMYEADVTAIILIPTATLDAGTNRADLVAALADKFGIAL